MNARFALTALALAFGVATTSCSRRDAPPRDTLPADTSKLVAALPAEAGTAATAPHSDGGSVDAGGALPGIAIARSIGNTSVVFKLTLESGEKYAFKPRSRRGRERYRGEIAAYRLARALDLSLVPEANVARFSAASLEAAAEKHASSLDVAKKELVPGEGGLVVGALIPWFNDYDVLRLETEPWRSRWRGWLVDAAPIPDADRALAVQIAEMIVFDSVTGNWDRWSGANIGWRASKREILMVDNDGAFMVPQPVPFEKQRELLRALKRYPKKLVLKLRDANEATMRAAIGEESAGVPLLSDSALRDLEQRRRAVIAEADARTRELGEPRVYAFD